MSTSSTSKDKSYSSMELVPTLVEDRLNSKSMKRIQLVSDSMATVLSILSILVVGAIILTELF